MFLLFSVSSAFSVFKKNLRVSAPLRFNPFPLKNIKKKRPFCGAVGLFF